VDLILVESMSSIREAVAAVRAALRSQLPIVVGFVSWDRDRILSGEPLRQAARRVLEAGATVAGVNCLPPSSLPDALASLAPLGAPLLVSPNLGEPDDEKGFARAEDVSPEAFAAGFEGWLEGPGAPRVALVGGCCGTTPAHLAALARRMGTSNPAPTPDSVTA